MSVIPPTGIIRKYYEDAIEDIEYKSSGFWQVWLQREFGKDVGELDIYAVTSEASPDGSRRRVDQVVKRYDPSHHTLSSLVWNECKRPSGSAREAEQQALDAARRCIQRENLLWIYALTTVGVTFRVWKVSKHNLQLTPLGSKISEYVDADSPDAWILRASIQEIKDYFPLGDAPVLPSQSNLLGKYGGEWGSIQECLDPLPSMSGEADMQWSLPPLPDNGEEYGQQEMPPSIPVENQNTYYGNEAEGLPASHAQSVNVWSKADIHRIRHMTRPDEYSFRTVNGHEKLTERDGWKETKYKGRKAWYYRHRGSNYYTREQPGE